MGNQKEASVAKKEQGSVIHDEILCSYLKLGTMDMVSKYQNSKYYQRSFEVGGSESKTKVIVLSEKHQSLNSLKHNEPVKAHVLLTQDEYEGVAIGITILAYLVPREKETTGRIFFTDYQMHRKNGRRGYHTFSESLLITFEDY